MRVIVGARATGKSFYAAKVRNHYDTYCPMAGGVHCYLISSKESYRTFLKHTEHGFHPAGQEFRVVIDELHYLTRKDLNEIATRAEIVLIVTSPDSEHAQWIMSEQPYIRWSWENLDVI